MAANRSIREQKLALRDRLEPLLLERKSRKITAHLFSLPAFAQSTLVMFYASFRSEVSTWPAMDEWLALGRDLCLPRTLLRERRLVPHLVRSLAEDLLPGYCAIPEPRSSEGSLIAPEKIELVIVPGSAFDLKGGRLGYGGGFYDRFLARAAPQALRVALAYELQLSDRDLPLAPHDQPMDYLVTEKKVYRFTEKAVR